MLLINIPGKKPGHTLWNETVITVDVAQKASSTPENVTPIDSCITSHNQPSRRFVVSRDGKTVLKLPSRGTECHRIAEVQLKVLYI